MNYLHIIFMMPYLLNKFTLVFLTVFIFFIYAIPVHASFFDPIIDGAKNILNLSSQENSGFTITSDIQLIEDKNNNNQIDSGDIVVFIYKIINTTDKNYSYATLKTHINRKKLNFIHSLRGSTGISQKDNSTINFPNIRIGAQEERVVSFNARINFSQDDIPISTEPEFLISDDKSSMKFAKKEIIAKKLGKKEYTERIKKRSQIMIEKLSQ